MLFFYFFSSRSSFRCNLRTSFQHNESFKGRSRFICGFSCRLWVAERFSWVLIDWPQVSPNGPRSPHWGNGWHSIGRQWHGKRVPFILWRWGSVDSDPSATLVLINSFIEERLQETPLKCVKTCLSFLSTPPPSFTECCYIIRLVLCGIVLFPSPTKTTFCLWNAKNQSSQIWFFFLHLRLSLREGVKRWAAFHSPHWFKHKFIFSFFIQAVRAHDQKGKNIPCPCQRTFWSILQHCKPRPSICLAIFFPLRFCFKIHEITVIHPVCSLVSDGPASLMSTRYPNEARCGTLMSCFCFICSGAICAITRFM